MQLLCPPATATEAKDAVLVSLFLSVGSPVLTPLKSDPLVEDSWHKGASFEGEPNQTFWGGEWCHIYGRLHERASSPPAYGKVHQDFSHGSSRQKMLQPPPSPETSPFALFMNSLEQLRWCRWQILLEGLLATRLWPGDYWPNPNASEHRERVGLLEQLLWVKCFAHPGSAPSSTDFYCLCFSTKSSSVFNRIMGDTRAKAHGEICSWNICLEVLHSNSSPISKIPGDKQLQMQNRDHLGW